MARIHVYKRSVDAVVTDISLSENGQTDIFKTQIKAELPDTESNNQQYDSSAPTTNEGNSSLQNIPLFSENTYSYGHSNNKENECTSNVNYKNREIDNKHVGNSKSRQLKQKLKDPVSPMKQVCLEHIKKIKKQCINENLSIHSKNLDCNANGKDAVTSTGEVTSTVIPVNEQHKILKITRNFKSKKQFICDICSLSFTSDNNCKLHKSAYRNKYFCPKCTFVFEREHLLKHHELLCDKYSKIVKKTKRNIICHFCDRRFAEKNRLQAHLFHSHLDSIESGDNGKDNNENNGVTVLPSLDLQNNITEISGNDLFDHTNDLVNLESPAKRMRQTTLMEFLQFSNRNAKKQKTEENNCSDLFSLDKPVKQEIQLLKESCSSSNKVELLGNTSNDHETLSARCKPFVKIHASSNLLMTLLNDTISKIKEETINENLCNSNNLETREESPHGNISFYQSNTSLNVSRDNNKRSSHQNVQDINLISEQVKSPTTKLSDAVKARETALKASFNCKELVIPIKRLDQISVASTSSKADERISSVPSTKIFENNCNTDTSKIVSQDDLMSKTKENNIPLKQLKVSLMKLPKIYCNEVKTNFRYKLNCEDSADRIFHCKVCKKTLPSKESKRVHIKQYHMAYMSSVCAARFTTKHKLLDHYLCRHSYSDRNICCVCRQKFEDKIGLKRHLLVHCIKILRTNEDVSPLDVDIHCSRTRRCSKCQKSFKSKSVCKKHRVVCEDTITNINVNPVKRKNKFPPILLQHSKYDKNYTRRTMIQARESKDTIATKTIPSTTSSANEHIQCRSPINILKSFSTDQLDTHKSSVNTCEISDQSEPHLIEQTESHVTSMNKPKTCETLINQSDTYENSSNSFELHVIPVNQPTVCEAPLNQCEEHEHSLTKYDPDIVSTNSCETSVTNHTKISGFASNESEQLVFTNKSEAHQTPIEQSKVHRCSMSQSEPNINSVYQLETSINQPQTFLANQTELHKDFSCNSSQPALSVSDEPKTFPHSINQSESLILCESEHQLCLLKVNMKEFVQPNHTQIGIKQVLEPSMQENQKKMDQADNGEKTMADKQNLLINASKIKYPCLICGKQFHTPKNLLQHTRVFLEPANDRCKTCGIAFPTKRLLRAHISSAHIPETAESYRFHCRFCNQGFWKKDTLRSHEMHLHPDQTVIVSTQNFFNQEQILGVKAICVICNLMFETYEHFVEHNMYYYEGRAYPCVFCSESFQGMYMLHHHNKLVHYPEEKRQSYTYICKICDEGFTQERHYHAHSMHVHANILGTQTDILSNVQEGDTQEKFQSPVTTSSNSSQCDSVNVKNLVTNEYTCTVCKLIFSSGYDLTVHEMEYSNNGEFQCDKCFRRCHTHIMLNKHKSLTHVSCNISNGYKCRICGEVLATSVSLMCHEKHFHIDQVDHVNTAVFDNMQTTSQAQVPTKCLIDRANTNLVCLTCGMKFGNELELKDHLLEYSNIGDYECDSCSRRFVEHQRLETHKLKHSTLNSMLSEHHCPICQEGFTNIANVTAHIMHLHGHESFQNVLSKRHSTMKCSPSKISNDSHLNNTDSPTRKSDIRVRKDLMEISYDKCNDKEINGTIEKSMSVTLIPPVLRVNDQQQSEKLSSGLVNKSNKTVENISTLLDLSDQLQIDVPAKCSICNLDFNSPKDLFKHKIRYTNIGDYMCEICGRKFLWETMLQEHQRKHSEQVETVSTFKYICLLCNEKFRTHHSAHSHVVHLHDEVRSQLNVNDYVKLLQSDNGDRRMQQD